MRPLQRQHSRFLSAFGGILTLSALLAAPSGHAGMCTSANQTNCYRYLCNGVDASGNFSNDNCGTCNDSGAARWVSSTVPVRVDMSTLPSSMSQSDWSRTIDAVFGRWGAVSGSTLNFQNIGSTQYRTFGENSDAHEIFWITSVNEFQSVVGSGVNGALGVTLTPRICSEPGEIYDADLVMNGAGFNDWVPFSDECSGFYCNSAVSTLTHELGHFVGLGHPCTACSFSVMSAQSAYDVETPLAVDRAAVGVLYPGNPGGVGYGCNSTADCTTAPLCAQVGDLKYCTQSCGTCPDGFECKTEGSQGDICEFAAGANATPAGIGDACAQRVCDTGLTCVGAGNNDFTCYESCTTDSQCPTNFSCVDLQGGGGVCLETSGNIDVGQPCSQTSGLCVDAAACILETQTSGFCRTLCTPATGAGCLANESCFELQQGQGACFPSGNVGEGGECADPFDCATGNVCLIDSPNNGAHCYTRCDQGFTCQNDQQTCQALSGAGVSYCDPLSSNITPTPNPSPSPSPGPSGEPGVDPGPGVTPPPNGGCWLPRGNWDCPNGYTCDDDGNGDETGVCTEGGEGAGGTGALCDNDSDCEGGICHNGVCTRPCDVGDGCVGGYTCDPTAIQGGLCKADSCANDKSICDDGWGCAYSSAQRNVCVRGVSTGYCSCVTTGIGGDGDEGHPQYAGVLALIGLGVLVRRRRSREHA